MSNSPKSPIEGQVMSRETFERLQQGDTGISGKFQHSQEQKKPGNKPVAPPPRDAQGRIIIGGGDDAPDPNGQMA